MNNCYWCDHPITGQVVHDLDDDTYFHLECAIKDREIELDWEGNLTLGENNEIITKESMRKL